MLSSNLHIHIDMLTCTQMHLHTHKHACAHTHQKMYHTYQVKYSFQELEDSSVDQDMLAV